MRLLVIETVLSSPEQYFPQALEDHGFRVHSARDPVEAKWLGSHGDYAGILLEADPATPIAIRSCVRSAEPKARPSSS